MPDGLEPIADDELLYRRIPVVHFEADTNKPSYLAFGPRKEDVTGLSLSRAKYKTVQQAAWCPRPNTTFYVAVLRAGRVPFEVLDREGCIAVEPGLAAAREKIVGGLRLPGDETGDCFKFTGALAAM